MSTSERAYRVVMIGDSQTGKTSIVSAMVGPPKETCAPTIGAAVTKNLPIRPSCDPTHTLLVNLWDTAGQEKYRSLGPMYYKGADAALAVFDLSNVKSFENLDEWVETFLGVVGSKTVCILGNKNDLTPEVTPEQIDAYVSQRSFRFFRTSARTGEGIVEAFTSLADDLLSAAGVHPKAEVPSPVDLQGITEKTAPCC
jgi:small GTP-binding protein